MSNLFFIHTIKTPNLSQSFHFTNTKSLLPILLKPPFILMVLIQNVKIQVSRKEKKYKFNINDNIDILIEILKRVDDSSLGVSACVCRLWCGLTRNEALWENLCFRFISPPPERVRTVVVALGGYRRLYMLCVKPVLSRLGELGVAEMERRVWSRHEVELSLSLFCVDYYQRVFLGGGGRVGGGSDPVAPSSLMFLCKAVNV